MLKAFLLKSNSYLFHYLITIDDSFGLLVLISIAQIPNKFFQNLTKPMQCYANWYARYVKSRKKYICVWIYDVCGTQTEPLICLRGYLTRVSIIGKLEFLTAIILANIC